VKLSGERLRLRVEHLREVIISACAQSGRTRLPALEAAASLEQGLRNGAQNAQPVLLMPGASQSLAQAAHGQTALALAVGPEGGFDEREAALASMLGFQAAHLGPRILRTETAGLAAMAALQAQAGDLA
ncbi:MAG TPA: RsmE family RNA methyltransferase, partial [Burkholderiaceae bacterium]|nr:RsmE family RNA methyltransferase [Burkholderiaceae bacterium]